MRWGVMGWGVMGWGVKRWGVMRWGVMRWGVMGWGVMRWGVAWVVHLTYKRCIWAFLWGGIHPRNGRGLGRGCRGQRAGGWGVRGFVGRGGCASRPL